LLRGVERRPRVRVVAGAGVAPAATVAVPVVVGALAGLAPSRLRAVALRLLPLRVFAAAAEAERELPATPCARLRCAPSAAARVNSRPHSGQTNDSLEPPSLEALERAIASSPLVGARAGGKPSRDLARLLHLNRRHLVALHTSTFLSSQLAPACGCRRIEITVRGILAGTMARHLLSVAACASACDADRMRGPVARTARPTSSS
jgi:hypothetical protein